MEFTELWLYLAVFLGAAALSLGLTPVALRVALRRRILDQPGGHKSHDDPVPYLGGAAITVAFVLVVLLAALIYQPVSGLAELGTILGAAFALALVGLADDLRGLGIAPRILTQAAAGAAIWWVGGGTQLTGEGWADLFLTVMWVVGITNAFNLLDNMDGLSAGVAAIAALAFFVIAVMNGQFLVAALSVALAGCAVGFLRHNFHPARIYMGDAGSLFLGFLLAAIGIKLRFEGPTEVTFFVPITILGVAIADTALVTITRLIHGRSPFAGARDHTSHRLVFVGVPVRSAVALIYASAIAHGWMAIAISRVDVGTGFLLIGLVVAGNVFLGILLANVPVYENSRQRHLMIQEVATHEPKVGA